MSSITPKTVSTGSTYAILNHNFLLTGESVERDEKNGARQRVWYVYGILLNHQDWTPQVHHTFTLNTDFVITNWLLKQVAIANNGPPHKNVSVPKDTEVHFLTECPKHEKVRNGFFFIFNPRNVLFHSVPREEFIQRLLGETVHERDTCIFLETVRRNLYYLLL